MCSVDICLMTEGLVEVTSVTPGIRVGTSRKRQPAWFPTMFLISFTKISQYRICSPPFIVVPKHSFCECAREIWPWKMVGYCGTTHSPSWFLCLSPQLPMLRKPPESPQRWSDGPPHSWRVKAPQEDHPDLATGPKHTQNPSCSTA